MYFHRKTRNILHFMNDFYKKIQERRESLGLSQRDVSEMSGVSLRTINSMESGKSNPSVDVLCKILESLGLKLTLSERVING